LQEEDWLYKRLLIPKIMLRNAYWWFDIRSKSMPFIGFCLVNIFAQEGEPETVMGSSRMLSFGHFCPDLSVQIG